MATYSDDNNANIKKLLGIQSTGDDKVLQYLREVAYEYINRQLGFVFNPSSSTTRTFDAEKHVRNDGRDLVTGYLHTVTSVINGDLDTIDSSEYVIVEKRIIRLKRNLGLRWNWSAKNDPTDAISVTAYFGLKGDTAYGDSSGTVPTTVQMAEEQLVIWMYRSLDVGTPLNVAYVAGSGIILTPATVPPWIQHLIERHRPIT